MLNIIQRFTLNGLALLSSLLITLSFYNPGTIVLQNEQMPFKATGYYIAVVDDERASKNSVAQLITTARNNGASATQLLDLQGGAATAISKFLDQNLPQNKSLRAVNITVKEFKLTETTLGATRIDGQLKLHLQFGLVKEYGSQPLVEYKGGMHYIRSTNSHVAAEPYLRSSLKNGLVFFNDWIKANDINNAKLAYKVKIIFTDYKEEKEGDTIYYAANRPLTWQDFKGKVYSTSRYAGGVTPSIGYNQRAKVVNGVIQVYLDMKTILPKSTCWVLPSAKNSYTLNHEQRHFDIAKIIAEQYKQALLSQALTPDNYEAIINMQYLDSYRDMYEMQKRYDEETSHGTRELVQHKWDDKISKQLRKNSAMTAGI
jgi:hypothetical protein